MKQHTYYLGILDKIIPTATGDPGERTFLLHLEGTHGTARLWLEKEQLLELAKASQQMYNMFDATSSLQTQAPRGYVIEEDQLDFECRISRLRLYHEPKQDLFVIEAEESSDDSPSTKIIEFLISVSQLADLSSQAFKICASGRPYCDLCGLAMDPDFHMCPQPTWDDSY